MFLLILEKHVPKKQKFIRVNNPNFVTKNLRKATIKRSKLWKKYLCEKPNEAKSLYNKQRNLFASTLLKNKRDYFLNLSNEIVTDERKLWKTISHLFSKKAFHRECATLKESTETITNNEELAETFNTYFSKIVPNFSIDNNLGDNKTSPILLIQFSVQSKSMKITQAFSKLRKWWVKKTYHFPLNLLIERKFNELQKPRTLPSLAGCLTDLCTSDFYWIFFSFWLPLIF